MARAGTVKTSRTGSYVIPGPGAGFGADPGSVNTTQMTAARSTMAAAAPAPTPTRCGGAVEGSTGDAMACSRRRSRSTAAARRARSAGSRRRSSVRAAWRRSYPFVNVSIIGLCSLVFLYELLIGGFGVLRGRANEELVVFFFTWGFIPGKFTWTEPFTAWPTIFSSLFVHAGFMHFAVNMLYLWVFGDNIEDRLGHFKYLVFYLAGGVVATLSHWLIGMDSGGPLIGASGAIAGVLGAYLFTKFRCRPPSRAAMASASFGKAKWSRPIQM